MIKTAIDAAFASRDPACNRFPLLAHAFAPPLTSCHVSRNAPRATRKLPAQSEWVVFVAALALVALFSVTVAVLPRSWIAKACRRDWDDEQLFLSPLKWLGGFAATAYLVALVAYLAPHSWDLDAQLMFALCPFYFVRMSFDPSPTATFLLLAPLNAGVYGSLGLVLGHVWLRFRK